MNKRSETLKLLILLSLLSFISSHPISYCQQEEELPNVHPLLSEGPVGLSFIGGRGSRFDSLRNECFPVEINLQSPKQQSFTSFRYSRSWHSIPSERATSLLVSSSFLPSPTIILTRYTDKEASPFSQVTRKSI